MLFDIGKTVGGPEFGALVVLPLLQLIHQFLEHSLDLFPDESVLFQKIVFFLFNRYTMDPVV